MRESVLVGAGVYWSLDIPKSGLPITFEKYLIIASDSGTAWRIRCGTPLTRAMPRPLGRCSEISKAEEPAMQQ